jgi:cyclopropane fatty-acyl-phospholipid synthase-like methyltransferase
MRQRRRPRQPQALPATGARRPRQVRRAATGARRQRQVRRARCRRAARAAGRTRHRGEHAAPARPPGIFRRREVRMSLRIDGAALPAATAPARRADPLAARVRAFSERVLGEFPWRVEWRDWDGRAWRTGGDAPHWCAEPLQVTLHRPEAARALLAADVLRFLDLHLAGAADLEGNLYLLSDLRAHARLGLSWPQALAALVRHRAFQTPARARLNVRSHYDIPQRALDLYLDRAYRAYSCAMFAEPARLVPAELVRAGAGAGDDFDSLERAQWRKFQDAIDFVAPEPGDTILDVGCGYGGQLAVALESHRFRRIVGWTHSANQAREGRRALARFDPARWELREGDYRDDDRVYQHVTSTGMVSHVGPRGLVPYVRAIRRRIQRGGRYLHHALMTPHTPLPLDLYPGTAFHKRYVWPGYHWFTLGRHVRALERNGFEVQRAVNLSTHYAKTTAAWHERLVARREEIAPLLGEPTFRAWRLYLAGSSGNFANKGIHVYRLYCEAV